MSETTTKKRKLTSFQEENIGSSSIDLGRYKSELKKLRDFCKSDLLSEEGLNNFFDKYKDFIFINNDDFIADNNIYTGYDFFFHACYNNNIDVGILRCLLKYFPNAAKDLDPDNKTPLHLACCNENVTPEIVQLLVDAAPRSVYLTSIRRDEIPLHHICLNEDLEEADAFEIIKILLSKYPQTAGMAEFDGFTPLHIICCRKHVTLDIATLLFKAAPGSVCNATERNGSTPIHHLCTNRYIKETTAIEVLKYLLTMCPESASIPDSDGLLPLHHACIFKTKEVCSVLMEAYPDAVNQTTNPGNYPIQYVLERGKVGVDIVEYLLACDPRVSLQEIGECSLLEWFCHWHYDESNVEAGVQMVNAIYDAHPDAINEFMSPDALTRMITREEVRTFIAREVGFVRHAREMFRLGIPDENGQLPLHRALANNAALGSIKLLVNGWPTTLDCIDNNGALPLHVACQHHNSSCVVQYLIDRNPTSVQFVDNDDSTALHLACRGAKYETIAILLEKHDALSLSKRNSHGKLPIDLLFESSEVDDRENVEYVGIVFRLLVAYPETLKCGL